ncbi:MAG TPA: DUF6298 domain-containing protein [Opitutaceae bacterium]|nr:DUF6298 domain-containing protein [Opitutaceae bacterium]
MKRLSLLRLFCGMWVGVGAVNASAAAPEVAINFSHAGYGGGAAVPAVPSVLRVKPTGGDDTAMLEAAIARVASLPVQPNGFRGALEFVGGHFRVDGQIRVGVDGVILRGSGNASNPTVIVATRQARRSLIELGGTRFPAEGVTRTVRDEIAPAGTRVLTLDSLEGLKVGSRIAVRRPSTKEWAVALGMDKFEGQGSFTEMRLQWLPKSRDLVWDRVVTEIDAGQKRITLDAPVTTALEQKFGGGTVAVLEGAPVRNVGIEDLVLDSVFNPGNTRDEEHAWIAVALDNVEDAWVRRVVARHFVSSAVRVGWRGRRISVEDCRSEEPVSELGGYRRQSFFVEGQQVLVRDCVAEDGLNDFATGFCAAGPNVFLNCRAVNARGPSGSFESWSSGVLYERVTIEGAALKLTRDNTRSQGGGWTAANSIAWNCTATSIETSGPESAPNLSVNDASSLFETQLANRVGKSAAAPATPSRARAAALFAWKPAKTAAPKAKTRPVQIVGGRFVADGRAVWGGAVNAAWWKGQTAPGVAAESGLSITRFVPGRTGPGLTEDLPALAERMEKDGLVFYQSTPGLWYDRRRDDHQVIARADANVWAPFYELPWARSGEGAAWDGLSRYDLTKFNHWFFSRTREFAQLCDERGLLLFHNLYNTHNLLETQAHWVDFPWRPANAINEAGLPEPPPLDSRNAVHVANVFYNVEHAGRRALHRAYIFHTLDRLGEAANLIFGLGFQFAGPLAFQQFFLDTVAEWEKRTGRKVRISLTTSKDITDAILEDPVRSAQIGVIDLRYWQKQPDGKLWAPRGDVNLAFREQNTVFFGRGLDTPPDTTPLFVYRGVREYRDKFPDRAIVAWHGGAGPIPVFMAGGSHALMRNPSAGQSQAVAVDAAHFDRFVRTELGAVLPRLTPRDGWFADEERTWCLADDGDNVVVYSIEGESVTLARALPRQKYEGTWFDPHTGKTQPLVAPSRWDAGTAIGKPTSADWLLRLRAAK